MHRTLYILSILFINTFVFAQDGQSEDHYYQVKNSHSINLGLGIPSTSQVAAEFVSIVNQETKATPQFTLKYEFALNDKIGIGAYAGYFYGETEEIEFENIIDNAGDILCCLLNPGDECCEDNSSTQTGKEIYKVDVFTIGGLATFHFYKFPKLDTYSIFRLGYNFTNIRGGAQLNTEFLGFEIPTIEYFAGVGGRYFIKPNFGIYAEVGNSILSPLHINAGASLRMLK